VSGYVWRSADAGDVARVSVEDLSLPRHALWHLVSGGVKLGGKPKDRPLRLGGHR